jgi:hypothetical protein
MGIGRKLTFKDLWFDLMFDTLNKAGLVDDVFNMIMYYLKGDIRRDRTWLIRLAIDRPSEVIFDDHAVLRVLQTIEDMDESTMTEFLDTRLVPF